MTEKMNLARLKKESKTFEIVINPDLAFEYLEGKKIDIKDILKAEDIFYDAKKGMKISETDLKNYFHTDDILKAAEEILKKGEVQLTEEERKKIREEKYKRMLDIITKNSLDPKTNLPHPRLRIENALEEVKFKIKDEKTVEENVQLAIKAIRTVLPIKFESLKYKAKIKPQFIALTLSFLKKNTKILTEDYTSTGDLIITFEFPGGMLNEVIDKLNSITKGDIILEKI